MGTTTVFTRDAAGKRVIISQVRTGPERRPNVTPAPSWVDRNLPTLSRLWRRKEH